MNTAEQILIAENEQGVAEGKKEIKITEGRILLKAFRIIQDKGLWKGDKFRCYSNSSSMINIPKHGVAYEAQNNHCIDFYQKTVKSAGKLLNALMQTKQILSLNGKRRRKNYLVCPTRRYFRT